MINMNLDNNTSSITEHNTMDTTYQNKILIVATTNNNNNNTLSYPTSYNSIISITTIDNSDNHTSFSQYNNQIEVTTPNINMHSTLPNNHYTNYNNNTPPIVTGKQIGRAHV